MRACVENPLMELMTSLAVALAFTGLPWEESHRLNGCACDLRLWSGRWTEPSG